MIPREDHYHIVVDASGHYRTISVTYYKDFPVSCSGYTIVDTAPNYVDACYMAGLLNTTADVMES